jgi:signal transduction histidine kinase
VTQALAASISSAAFMPHGHCYLWLPSLVWTQVLANLAIGISYLAISSSLGLLVWRVRDIPFKAMYLAFGVFIVTCGFTHFMDVLTIWRPAYWADGWLRVVTALASVGTAVLLPPLLPKAEALARGARAAHERGVELEVVANELGTLYDRTRRIEQAKTQFFANVSHELRTPLALILGPAERLLADPALRPEQRRDLELVRRNACAVLSHVNDLLDAAKVEAGRLEVRWASVDVAALVRRTASQFEPIAAERATPFTIDTPEPVRAEVDGEHVERVVLNLLSNAFKFTPRERPVRVAVRRLAAGAAASTARHDEAFAIEVADGGPGIRPEDREAVFDRFRQLDGGSERAIGGTGLGLSIVRELVQLHGGVVTVGDAPEGGTRVTAVFPVAAPAHANVRAAGESASAANELRARRIVEELASSDTTEPTPAPGERPTVLVVEDNPDMNRFVRDSLGDFRTVGVPDGEAALDYLAAEIPDLIVTDVMMPRTSGDRLVEEIRTRPTLDAVPILVLSAKADDELRTRMLRDGAHDYVMKPFAPEELRARARNLVTVKRSRDLLQLEIDTQVRDLEALAHEVTHRKRELASALDSMRVAREYAEQANQAKSDFLRLVSHELRTPISNAALQVEILRRDPDARLTSVQHGALARLQRSMVRLSGLVESLLQYARTESGRLTVRPRDLALTALALDVIDELRPQADPRRLELVLEAPAALSPARSDPELVRLVMLNLAANAIKYTTGPTVTVRLLEVEDAHRIEIEDAGPGIPEDERRRIFEPFEQLEPSSLKTSSGVGLGLALVRQIAAALGASIELEDSPTGGSLFRFTLPRVARAPEDPRCTDT